MTKFFATAVAGLLLASAPAWAEDASGLAKAKECTSCHNPDKETLAPSFKQIAKKYAGKANAEASLVSTVMKGSPDMGGYHWGTMKMPSPGARATVSEVEAKALVGWILSLK
ncbi:MAG: c-type cytochrome [Rhodocyclaceae bacterium]|jgi:cytochrome c|nr:c-type cytochrome [Rhodocyclaceae bacterium]